MSAHRGRRFNFVGKARRKGENGTSRVIFKSDNSALAAQR